MPPTGRPSRRRRRARRSSPRSRATSTGRPPRDPDPGAPALHRLNRTEYANVVRDLLALDVDVSALLPPDDSAAGFDNIADVLGVSPALIEGYVAAAGRVSRLAMGDPLRGARSRHVPGARRRLAGRPRRWAAARHARRHRHPPHLPARRRVRHPGGPGGRRAPRWARGLRAHASTTCMSPSTARGSRCKPRGPTRIRIAAGPRTIAAAALVRGHGGAADGVYDVNARTPGVTQVTIAGPFNPTGPGDTPSRRRLLVCTPAVGGRGSQPCAAKILHALATRAYRRPVPTDGAEMRTLLDVYPHGPKAAARSRPASGAPWRACWSIPQFLFRFEREPANVAPGKPFRLADVELASRLSFFLWSSIPDDELLDAGAPRRAAKTGRRWNSRCAGCWPIRAPTRWWTTSPGSGCSCASCATCRPDSPDFDGSLRRSMQRETELLFRAVMREDRSVIDLLDADFTFVDERLATPLRHARHSRLADAPHLAGPGQSAARPAGPGQHPDDHVGGQPHVAGRPGQVGAREPAGRAAAAAAAWRRNQPGEGRRTGQGHLAPPAPGAAPRERRVRGLPQADGPDRADARELRPHRQVADGGRHDADRRLGPADRRHRR